MEAKRARVGANDKPQVAVISGAGPDAGIDLMQKILSQNRRVLGADYRSDRDAPYVVLFQVPGIGGPRGPRDLLDASEPPFQLVWTSLQDTVRKIDALRLDRFCISCNTLHMLEGRIRDFCLSEGIKAQFVSMIDVVKQHMGETTGIAIFGSLPVTSECDSPYRTLKRVPLEVGLRERLQNMLGRIKVEGPSQQLAIEFEGMLREVDADKFVLGCTEFPLLLPFLSEEWRSNKLVDPGVLVAEKLLQCCSPSDMPASN